MKEFKRCFCNFSYYDQRAIQEKLEDMASKGWMLEKPGSFLWTYRRAEPKKLRFSVTYFPRASEFDPRPTDGELTKIDYCQQDGWRLLTSWGVMQIFYNENLDAVPIETEPVAQVENLCRAMRKNMLFPQAVLCAMLLLNIFLRFSQWKRDPLGELSDPLNLYIVLMFCVLALACLWEIGFYFRWGRKARAAARDDGVFLPIQSKPVASWILAAVAVLPLLLVFDALTDSLGPAILGACAAPCLVMALGNLIKKSLKKRGVSRSVNRAVSVGSVVLATFLLLGLITASILRGGPQFGGRETAVGTYELFGRTMKVYDDPLPLEIEDLADVSAQWSKEADHQETFLLASTECRQYAVPMEGNDRVEENNLEYTVTEVKWDVLRDWFRDAALRARQDEVHGDFVFTDHYEPVDAAVWNADAAYQLHWSSGVVDTYLIFWGNRIVELDFSWEPTPEQIAAAAGKLGKTF